MENIADKNKKECKDYFSSDGFKKKQLEELKIAKEINSDQSLTWIQKMDKILELTRSRGGNIGGLTISPSFNKDGKYSENKEKEMIAHDFCLMFEASRDPAKCKITTEKDHIVRNDVEKIKTGYYISLCYQKRVIGYDDKDGDWLTHLFVKNANALFNISNFTAEETEAFCFSSKEEAEDYIDENYLKLLSMGSLTAAVIWHTDGIKVDKMITVYVPKAFACDKDNFFDDVRTNLKREVERLEKYCNRKNKTLTYDELYSHMSKFIQYLNAGYCFSGIRNHMEMCDLYYGQIGNEMFPILHVGFGLDVGYEQCKNYSKLSTTCIFPLFKDTDENAEHFRKSSCSGMVSDFVHFHNGEVATLVGVDESIAVAKSISFPFKEIE